MAVPPLRAIWRRVMEGHLEVDVLPTPPDTEPSFTVSGGGRDVPPTWGLVPAGLYATFRLRLLSHRTDRPERVIGCSLAVKRRRLRFWRQTLLEVPMVRRSDYGAVNVRLDPLSGPTEIDLVVQDESPDSSLIIPAEQLNGTEIVLVLAMVGPIRKLERKLRDVGPLPGTAG